MKKYTVLCGNKIIRCETKVEAIIKAWEHKMQGYTVKVVDDATCELIYS